ncbi:MAG: GNAT family N-acetyltransferase, partial [Burkholderiaceae bacterium]
DDQRRVLGAMSSLQALLEGTVAQPKAYLLREHQPGDIGWVISRHGALYAQEYGWNMEFEALVARICADFIDKFDASGERAWIAEIDGERVGCTFVVRKSKTVAQLRMVLLEPKARGLGIGKRMVNEAIAFARARGYTKMTLWTNACLHAARAIYQAAGFVLVKEEKHQSFGADLVGQNWELKL